MAIQTSSLYDITATLPDNSTLLLHEISWAEYEALLDLLPDNPRFRLSYDQGTLQIMTLSPRHERLKSPFAHLLAVLTEELDMNLVGLGSTTFKRADVARGLEPDDCYYITQAERMAGQDTIDLTTDPPPDLVVEVDISHPSLNKFSIYASLGVPEVWRHNGTTLQFFCLTDGQYIQTPTSGLFPILPAAVLAEFVQQGLTNGIIPMIRAWRSWVRAHR